MNIDEKSISPEELKKEVWRCLVQQNIITEKDLKKRVVKKPKPVLDNFVKATSYLLENHKSLFKLFKHNAAYYEAVKLARRLVEEKVIPQQEEPYHNTPYYFDKDDTSTMNSIDAKIKKYYPSGFIPIKHSFIRKKKIKVEPKSEPKSSLDSEVKKTFNRPLVDYFKSQRRGSTRRFIGKTY